MALRWANTWLPQVESYPISNNILSELTLSQKKQHAIKQCPPNFADQFFFNVALMFNVPASL